MQAQRGVVLIISLVMLVVLTLLAISAIRMSTASLRAVNASQSRMHALSAAQRRIDQALNTNFALDIGAVEGTTSVVIDGGKSYDVALSKPCMKSRIPIKNLELDPYDAEDQKCAASNTIWSDCARTQWELIASVNEGFFGVNVQMTQGVNVRMDNASAIAYSQTPSYVCT